MIERWSGFLIWRILLSLSYNNYYIFLLLLLFLWEGIRDICVTIFFWSWLLSSAFFPQYSARDAATSVLLLTLELTRTRPGFCFPLHTRVHLHYMKRIFWLWRLGKIMIIHFTENVMDFPNRYTKIIGLFKSCIRWQCCIGNGKTRQKLKWSWIPYSLLFPIPGLIKRT